MTVASRAVIMTAMTADKMTGVMEHSQTSDRGELVVETESTEYHCKKRNCYFNKPTQLGDLDSLYPNIAWCISEVKDDILVKDCVVFIVST